MDTGYLFAALIWGSIGLGLFIYGKKQKSPAPLAGGILLMSASYFVKTPMTLSIFGTAIIAVIFVLKKVM